MVAEKLSAEFGKTEQFCINVANHLIVNQIAVDRALPLLKAMQTVIPVQLQA